MAKLVGVYVRISRDKVGAGLGVQRQEDDCRTLADKLGWHVVDVYADNDLSAYSGKPRPEYKRMLQDLQNGRINAVVAWHTDRLHRSPAELEHYINVCESREVPTQCVTAGELDLSTPSGRMQARIAGAVARHEVEHSVERAKRAKLQAASEGRFRGGKRPFGFEKDGINHRDAEAGELSTAGDRVLAGESLSGVAKDWNTRGVKTSTGGEWTSTSVKDVMLRPRNAGLIVIQGQTFTAEWEPVMDPDTWRALRAKLTDPSRATNIGKNRAVHLGSGLYVCGECGATLRASGVPGNSSRRIGYRCRLSPHVHRVADPLDDYVTEVVLSRLARGDAVDLLPKQERVDVTSLHARVTTLRGRLDELASLFAEGAIDASQLSEGTQKLKASIAEAEREIERAASVSVLADIVGVDDVEAVWMGKTLAQRKAIVDAVCTVTVLKQPRGRQPGGGYFNPDYVRIDWR